MTQKPEPDCGFDSLITIRWDHDEGRVVYDLGEIDDFAAYAILNQVQSDVRSRWPDPREINDPPDDEDDDS